MSGSTPVLIWSAIGRLDALYGEVRRIPVNLNPDSATVPLVLPPGCVLGEVLATQGLYGFYNSQASDGTNNAKGILEYEAAVVGTPGSKGQPITWVGGEWPGLTYYNVPMIYGGPGLGLDLSQLYGLDSTAVTSLGASIVSGALGVQEQDSLAQTGGSGTFALTVPSQTLSGVTYPAFTLALESATITAAQLKLDLNAAFVANGIPAWVTVTGGAMGSNPCVVEFYGVYNNLPIVMTVDNTNMSGGTVVNTRSQHGVAAYGILRLG